MSNIAVLTDKEQVFILLQDGPFSNLSFLYVIALLSVKSVENSAVVDSGKSEKKVSPHEFRVGTSVEAGTEFISSILLVKVLIQSKRCKKNMFRNKNSCRKDTGFTLVPASP